MKNWIIEQSHGSGIIRHTERPRFAARWTTGNDPDELAAIEGHFWTDEGSGSGEDQISIYGFEWMDPPPQQGTFETLMAEAARAIDGWLATRL